jgi:hypothetical protein
VPANITDIIVGWIFTAFVLSSLIWVIVFTCKEGYSYARICIIVILISLLFLLFGMPFLPPHLQRLIAYGYIVIFTPLAAYFYYLYWIRVYEFWEKQMKKLIKTFKRFLFKKGPVQINSS